MKKKLDIRKAIATKKYHIPKKLPYGFYHFVGKTHLLGAKYHPKYEIIDKIAPGPCFLIWNHQSRRDHTFLCSAAWPRRISIMCEYNEFFRSHLHFAFDKIDIIPKKVYVDDFLSIKLMSSIIKQGGCLAFSPEGTSSIFGNNQPIVPGTGRFLKHYGIPVYCTEISGSYLTNNKICEQDRPGKVFVKQYLLFTPEDLERLSAEEIETKINEVFHHDDYQWNKTARIKYKSKGKICTNLQDICYKCPKCGHELEMDASGDYIKCNHCGNGAKMNDYYDFIPFDDTCVIPESPVKWMEYERQEIIKEIRKDENYSFSENVELGLLPNDHYIKDHKTSEIVGKGKVTVDHNGFHFVGTKDGQDYSFDISYKQLYTLNITVDMTIFSLYYNGEYHEFHPERRSAGKILILVEEMHRLHVNNWKNFPWYDYMYKLDQN